MINDDKKDLSLTALLVKRWISICMTNLNKTKSAFTFLQKKQLWQAPPPLLCCAVMDPRGCLRFAESCVLSCLS